VVVVVEFVGEVVVVFASTAFGLVAAPALAPSPPP